MLDKKLTTPRQEPVKNNERQQANQFLDSPGPNHVTRNDRKTDKEHSLRLTQKITIPNVYVSDYVNDPKFYAMELTFDKTKNRWQATLIDENGTRTHCNLVGQIEIYDPKTGRTQLKTAGPQDGVHLIRKREFKVEAVDLNGKKHQFMVTRSGVQSKACEKAWGAKLSQWTNFFHPDGLPGINVDNVNKNSGGPLSKLNPRDVILGIKDPVGGGGIPSILPTENFYQFNQLLLELKMKGIQEVTLVIKPRNTAYERIVGNLNMNGDGYILLPNEGQYREYTVKLEDLFKIR